MLRIMYVLEQRNWDLDYFFDHLGYDTAAFYAHT